MEKNERNWENDIIKWYKMGCKNIKLLKIILITQSIKTDPMCIYIKSTRRDNTCTQASFHSYIKIKEILCILDTMSVWCGELYMEPMNRVWTMDTPNVCFR